MRSLYTEDNGDGQPTLVFLHYFGGSSKTWRLVVDLLADRFRCITVDLPGFGASAQASDYSVDSSAQALADSVSDLNLGNFILVGHSMGAKIALQYATARPKGLHAVILAAGSPPVPEPMKDEDRQALIKMYGDTVLIKKHLGKIIHRSVPDDLMEELVADNLRASQAAWVAWAETGSREDISADMVNISVPVHFIAGEFDDPLSPGYMQMISNKYLGGLMVRKISNAGHLLPIEAPVELASLISFIALGNM